MTSLSAIWNEIETAALEAGASRVGAAPLEIAQTDVFDRWIEAGRHASMAYLAKNREVRSSPSKRFPWANSVVVITVPYSSERPDEGFAAGVARYAQGDDYHDVLDAMLRKVEEQIKKSVPDSKTWRYVDTGPLSDRAYGAAAGLGFIGKNGMLIDEKRGSYFFIGTLLTSFDYDFEPLSVTDRCGRCTRCIDACPTDAILPDRTIDSHRCISYLTIEHRGEIDPSLAGQLGSNLFGCDICQEVCPWNRAAEDGHPAFDTRDTYRGRPIHELLSIDQEAFSTLFRKSAIKRAKLEGMKRNARLIAPDLIAARRENANLGVEED